MALETPPTPNCRRLRRISLRRLDRGAIFGLLALLALAPWVAADDGGWTVSASPHDEFGAVLVGPGGSSLYLFTNDADGVSTCYDQCAQAWPPLLTDASDVVVGDGVDSDLVGTVERSDGSMQVTYAGWPLYTFAGDAVPGASAGHGLSNVWFLVTATGAIAGGAEASGGELVSSDESVAQVDLDVLMHDGRDVYRSICINCHGDQGQGGIGEPLTRERNVNTPTRVIRAVLFGGHQMPAFGDQLSDHEIAAVATFIRNSFGNAFDPISEEEVAALRP
jgi:predicted lipoprotein with Yx(FWY)xxD motif